jgi:hypothetical protein
MKNLCRLSGMILLIYIISSCEKKPITPSASTPTILTAIKNITQTTATFEGLVMEEVLFMQGEFVGAQLRIPQLSKII